MLSSGHRIATASEKGTVIRLFYNIILTVTRLQVVLLSNNCPAAWPRQVDFFSQWSYWFPSHKKNSPTECSLATTERSCTSCAEVWREPPPSSPSHSRPAEPSSPAAATLRPSTSSGWLRFCFFVEIVTKCDVWRLDEGRATEGQVLAGSPPQVRWWKIYFDWFYIQLISIFKYDINN